MKGALVTPEDIFLLSRDDTIIDAVLHYWRAGDMSWEQAMMQAVVHLAAQVRETKHALHTEIANHPPSPIIIDSKLIKPNP